MTKYRFFRTNFFDGDHKKQTFDICIFKVGRRNGFVTTGSILSFKECKNKTKAGWYCNGTLREHKVDLDTREIAQSTARKLMGRCPVRFYENVMAR